MIRHRFVETNGIRMHIAEAGSGPLVLLCHGWPELWYSWRHQLTALAEAGYHAVAPDMRGYGESDAPAAIEDYTLLHTAGDVIGLIGALGRDQAVVIGHDWGAPVAWNAAMMRPDRVRAVMGLSVPYHPRGKLSLIDVLKARGLDRFYIMFFQEPGRAEADFDRDPRRAMRRVLYSISGDIPEGKLWNAMTTEAGSLVDAMWEPPEAKLPPWLTEEDLEIYASAYAKSGFRGGFNWYRCLHRNWQLMGAFAEAPIQVPAQFLVGSRDGTLKLPGAQAAIERFHGLARLARPDIVIEGAGHWVQQERPSEVNRAILDFLAGL